MASKSELYYQDWRLQIGHVEVESYFYRFNVTVQEYCEIGYCEENEIQEAI